MAALRRPPVGGETLGGGAGRDSGMGWRVEGVHRWATWEGGSWGEEAVRSWLWGFHLVWDPGGGGSETLGMGQSGSESAAHTGTGKGGEG